MQIESIGSPMAAAGSAVIGTPAAAPTGKSFGQFLSDAIGEVNDAQLKAGGMAAKLAAGDKVDVHQVMIAAQEANVSLNLALQVRNKLVDAYQEIMHVTM